MNHGEIKKLPTTVVLLDDDVLCLKLRELGRISRFHIFTQKMKGSASEKILISKRDKVCM